MTMELFGGLMEPSEGRPLAEKLRPKTLGDVVGQEHLTGPEGLLTKLIAAGRPASLIFWGPPGCGKTTLARLYAAAFEAEVIGLSAVMSGVADVRRAVDTAEMRRGQGLRTVVFVDEIHRFNKAQQDALLPHVEKGTFILVGATTENPSFSLNNALLSRAQVIVVKQLDEAALEKILRQAENEVGALPLDETARARLVALAAGDGRRLLNLVEMVKSTVDDDAALDETALLELLPEARAVYDKDGDWHYDIISALHKSVRGSDPDAALYYVARMLQGGEDGMYISRRLVRMAVEDIALADPQALPICIAAQEAYRTMGSPEGDLALAEAAVYLALAPKSNRLYMAFKAAKADAARTMQVPPPMHIVNAPTKLMKELGHGKGYVYDPDTESGVSGQNYWPEGLADERPEYYVPLERGFERELEKRLAYFKKFRQART
jgi:putative ATPase